MKEENIIAISTVVVGELKGLALSRNWGTRRIEQLQNYLNTFLIIPINRIDIHDCYAEIYAYSQNKLTNRSLPYSARNMGKNDLWIAATASVLKGVLITQDKDFEHLEDIYFKIERE